MSQPKKPSPPKDTNVIKAGVYKKPTKPLLPSKLVTNK